MFKLVCVFLLISLSIINGQQFGARCAARTINWVDSDDTWHHSPTNWSPSHIPEKWNFARLKTDTTGGRGFNVTVTQDVNISRIEIGTNGPRVHILPDVFMLLADYELHCWERKWCHNQGTCVGLNTCQCDPGWTGEDCDVPNSICPNPSDERDFCGVCGGDGTLCRCADYIETPVEEVARLLFLYNNQQIKLAVEEIINQLNLLKTIASFYDPNTQRLTPEIKVWLLYLQHFCDVCLDTFYRENWEFLRTLDRTPLTPDPCDM